MVHVFCTCICVVCVGIVVSFVCRQNERVVCVYLLCCRFVRNVDSVKQLRATFLNMYLLDQVLKSIVAS